MSRYLSFLLLLVAASLHADQVAHFHEPFDPYYVGLNFPKLTTPQWIGDSDVDAVILLSIDDMRDPAVYAKYLAPIIDRLKQHYGKAPLSIFANNVDPADGRLQSFLNDGVSIEVHTVDHPCPLLKDGDFAAAKSTYDRCVDMLGKIPNMQPVAFRMPCCDSLNTPSPRFWAEIFNSKTPEKKYLHIDTSVFNIFTDDDPELPKSIVLNEKDEPRFRRYVPFQSYVNSIENYPYPYIIGNQCWEFPNVVPSDWSAQHVQQPNNPRTVQDLKVAIDATVLKKGVMPLVFHPYDWIRSQQIAELVDYAHAKYGKRVAFLSFRDALQRLNQHLLASHTIRDDNGDTGVRLVDLNNDGYLDVVIPTSENITTRVWENTSKSWQTTTHQIRNDAIHFGIVHKRLQLFTITDNRLDCFEWDGHQLARRPVYFLVTPRFAYDNQIPARGEYQPAFRDIDGDGTSELILATEEKTVVLRQAAAKGVSFSTAFRLPKSISSTPLRSRNSALRFRDINEDQRLDLIFSNGQTYAVHLFESAETGWGPPILSGKFGAQDSIPSFVRPDGTNNGAWFHSNHLWVQNEDTNRMPNLVDRYAYKKMIAGRRESEPSLSEFPPAKSPADALNSFSPRKGVRFELVASEPLIEDPVAFDWGPDGSLWVVEMRDYPNGLTWNKQGDPRGEPGGRIKRLMDTDGDGKFDQAQLFLDKLPFPTAIKVWRDGVIVASAPHLFYAEDTTGDGTADLRKVLYEGFAEGNQQHRVNGLRWGIDQWLYLANGDSGGRVRSLKTDQTVKISGRDLKIKPDEGLIQAQTGMTQSGRNRDDDGNWFGGDNSNPIRHYVLDESYLKRNPNFASPSPRRAVSEVPGAAPIFPASRTVTRFNDYDRANRYTSACSPMVFREQSGNNDDLKKFVYVCEPVHNLVGREVLSDRGLTFNSRRAEQEQSRELIASSDNWFRPVMIRTGPDGALWIADMYRLVIEHPEWIPKVWQDKLDLRGGTDMGRIYRVVFEDIEDEFAAPDWRKLDSAPTAQLVDFLDCSNGTVRDMVHQLLLWRNDRNAIPRLTQLLDNAEWPTTQPHAMYLLDSLDALSDAQLAALVRDANSRSCRHAMRIAETRLANDDSKILVDAILHIAKTRPTTSIGLRNLQQAAYSIGYVKDDRAAAVLAAIAHDYQPNPLMVAAVFSSVREDNVKRLFTELLNRKADEQLILDSLKQAVAFAQTSCLNLAIAKSGAKNQASRFRYISSVSSIAQRKGLDLGEVLDKQSQAAVKSVVSLARKTANDDQADDAIRIQAIRLLAESEEHIKTDTATLLKLLEPQFSPELQQAALEQISNSPFNLPNNPQLLDGWKSYSPALRDRILDLLMTKNEWQTTLLKSIAEQRIRASEVKPRHRNRLLDSPEDSIRVAASSVFDKPESSGSRADVIERYQSVSQLAGEPVQGKLIFAKQCGRCHRLDATGKNVGPDLASLTDKSTSAMLTAILAPNQSVEDKYLEYYLLDAEGRQYTGIISTETSNSVTLTMADGNRRQVLRTEIDELRCTGRSLMPVGLEQEIPVQGMADLLSYVRSVSVPRKQFAGNAPQVAPVRDDGSIRLFAIHARIYGPTVELEPRYKNLGMWSNRGDRAVWKLKVPTAGRYSVNLDYACSSECSGNRLQLIFNGTTFSARVPTTGSWDNYAWKNVGTINLPQGDVEITLKADGNINQYLGDFRTIILEPRD